MGRRRALLVPAVLACLLGPPAAAASAAATAGRLPGCTRPAALATTPAGWPPPAAVWPLTRGDGIRVAVLSSGVDVRNGQLGDGAVDGGGDVVGSRLLPTTDCDGRGTFLAGLVAARRSAGTPFAGIAPAATVIPIRVVQTFQDADGTRHQVGGRARDLAAGVRLAVAQGASVICVPMEVPEDSTPLRAAVAAAARAGALVVAGGPFPQDTRADPATRPFPAAYPQVLAVLGVDADGAAYAPAMTFPGRQVVVPADSLVSTAPGTVSGGLGHTAPHADPAGAVAIVAGTAALVRAYRPDLSPEEVRRRLVTTAVPAAVATGGRGMTGIGLLDPVHAVTADPVTGRRPVVAAPAAPPPQVDGPSPTAARAATLSAGLAGLTAGAGLVALTVSGARRRARGTVSASGPPR